jgi:hypothetical protein
MFKHFLIITIILIFLPCGIGCCSSLEVDPYPDIEIPVFAGARNLKIFRNKEKAINSVDYYISIDYPANQVLEFYTAKLERAGFKRKANARAGWECFVDGTINEGVKIRQMIVIWNNDNRQIEAFLALIYQQTDNEWKGILNVRFQFQPLSKSAAYDSLIKELQAAGNETYNIFMELLDRYRGEDGEIDIDKAIAENPKNRFLLKVKEIIGR